MSSNQNEAYDDDEKYWYQTKIPNSDLFDDNVGFESLLNAAKEVESLNKTRLDLIGDNKDLLDQEPARSVEPIARSDIRGYSLPNTTSTTQSARYGYAKRSTVYAKPVVTSGLIDKIPEETSTKSEKQHVFQTAYPQYSSEYNGTSKFKYKTCLPMSFYNPCEYDVDQLDYKRIVIDLMLNRPADLTVIKTRVQKEALIKNAIRIGDGNAILPAILHLKNTMSGESFYKLLKGKSWLRGEEAKIACDHYVTYLKVFENSDMITQELQNIGLVEEAMKYNIYEFNRNFNSEFEDLISKKLTNSDNVVDFIGRQYKTLLTILGGLKNVQYGKLISQQMFFLDVKKRLFHDMHQATASNTYFQQLAKSSSPRDIVKFTVLYPKFELDKISKRFGLEEQEFAFIQLECYSEQKDWTELMNNVTSSDLGRNLTHNKKIPWAIIADVASEAPKHVLAEFIRNIQNPYLKFECAERHECYELAVDVLANEMKDRNKLDAFKSTIPRDCPAYMKAVQYLSSMSEASTSENALTTSGVFNTAITTGAGMASGLNAMFKKERTRFRDFFRKQ